MNGLHYEWRVTQQLLSVKKACVIRIALVISAVCEHAIHYQELVKKMMDAAVSMCLSKTC